MARSEAAIMAKAIIESNDGQAYFNINEASKIIGCGRNKLVSKLTDAGVLVKRIGSSKRISAYDLATYMCTDRVIPYWTKEGR